MEQIMQLQKLCKKIRWTILNSTTKAGSGHPTSSLSAVELATTLFFARLQSPSEANGKQEGFFCYDFENPQSIFNDRFILSKGHASPLLYSLYHTAGLISTDEVMTLRQFNSPLEGHPTPRLSFIDIATGSLGQGLSAGVGMALGIKLEINNQQPVIRRLPKVYVLLGDSESAEGQIWEAAEIASHYKLDNLTAILDVNRLGQRGETMLGWDIESYAKRFSAFGWNTILVDDGHDFEKVYKAYQQLTNDRPNIIIAKTVKGKGVSFLENQDNWHGKAVPQDKLAEALNELGEVDLTVRGEIIKPGLKSKKPKPDFSTATPLSPSYNPYPLNFLVSTREAYGDALVELGKINSNIVALDAEVSNSTLSEKFKKIFPERFFEMYIAEQNMVSTALGLSKLGFIPFISTFAAFLTRTFDQIRMTEISRGNVKFVGSHAGVFIGQDGPSQMGLQDIAMMRSILNSVVLYPSDAVCALKLTEIMAKNNGIFYLRTNREKTPVLYSQDEKFEVGGSKIHELMVKNPEFRVVVVAAGVTLHESLKAQKELAKDNIEAIVVDAYSVKPLDVETLNSFTDEIRNFIVVEDHYPYGGLGEAVKAELSNTDVFIHHLAVKKIPRSGKPEELLNFEEINSEAIIKVVKSLIK